MPRSGRSSSRRQTSASGASAYAGERAEGSTLTGDRWSLAGLWPKGRPGAMKMINAELHWDRHLCERNRWLTGCHVAQPVLRNSLSTVAAVTRQLLELLGG